MKFKIGDRVRIVKNNGKHNFNKYIGKIAKIIDIDKYLIQPYKLDISSFYWHGNELELIDDSKDKAKLEMFGQLVNELDFFVNHVKAEYIQDAEREKGIFKFDTTYKKTIELLNKAKELMKDDIW